MHTCTRPTCKHTPVQEPPVSTHLLEDGDGAPPAGKGVQHLVLQNVPQLEGALLAAQNHFVQVGAGMDKGTDVEGGITELHFQVHSCYQEHISSKISR